MSTIQRLEHASIRGPRETSSRTRARILQAARSLFNEQGTGGVSTNHIAAAAGISPGNLYYHYTDKRDIIRALHAEFAAAHDGLWRPSDVPAENVARLRDGLAAGAIQEWEYRFLGREVLALLRGDPKLRADYEVGYRRRLGEWLTFGEALVDQGILRPPRPPRTLHELTVALWLIHQAWLPFLDATGDPEDPTEVRRGIDLVLAVIDPLLTARGHRSLAAAGVLTAPGDPTELSQGTA